MGNADLPPDIKVDTDALERKTQLVQEDPTGLGVLAGYPFRVDETTASRDIPRASATT
jgi:hypothetical protein